MPTYEYRCPKGHEFEKFFRTISGAPTSVNCPTCGEVGVRQLSGGAGLLFKGSGFYLTDYGKNAHATKGPKPAATEGKKGEGATSSGDSKSSGDAGSGGGSNSSGTGQSSAPASGGTSGGTSAPASGGSSGSSSGGSGVQFGRQRLDGRLFRQSEGMSAADRIRGELARAARALGAPDPVEPVLERPRDPQFGEWATNLAMTLARPLRKSPRDVATSLIAAMDLGAAGVSGAEIAGPGFINFRIAAADLAAGLPAIVSEGTNFGRRAAGDGRAVNVEFVSANPTGPLHVGHGRQAALGDAIAALLEWTGWKVSREFYYNDAGVQIANLALSVQARVAQLGGREAAVPEGGYHGEYIREIAARYVAEHPHDAAGADLDAIRAFAVQALRHEQDLDLQAFGVKFDTYFLESSLYSDGNVEKTVAALTKAGATYEKDDALWLRTTQFGDDKDRVMRKRDGSFTYFLPDVAYHVTKWERGFRRAINVQGADHHSTVTRVRAGLQALGIGIPEGYPDYVLHQLVTVMRGGEEMKISKRAGSYVTVRDLIDEVGRDAVRYFFLMRKGDSQLVFDIDLARSQSEENPVYYIQMAHARLAGIFRVGEIDPASVSGAGVDFALLSLPEEQELVKALLDFPALIAGAAEALEPHRVASYLLETARKIHLWYHKAHVLNEPEEITRARLLLARAAMIVIRNGLSILGITAPERM